MRRSAAGLRAAAGLALVLGAIVLVLPRFMSTSPKGHVAQKLAVERVVFDPDRIELTVRNGGSVPASIAQVSVNGAYWQFGIDRPEIGRLQTGRIVIQYPWSTGEPLAIEVVSSDGQTLGHVIDFPVRTPRASKELATRYVPLGLAMGLLPVSAGMLLRPVLRRSSKKVSEFFLAFTVGVLLAIGVESAFDAFQLAGDLVEPLAGRLLVVTISAASFGLIYEWSRRISSRDHIDRALIAAWSLTLAIGLHNLGEGLAVAGAEAAGSLAVGELLALGFAVHNVSEGVAIAAVVGDKPQSLRFYQGAAALAGLPALVGLLAGSLAPSRPVSVVLLAVGLGAIGEVVAEVWSLIVPDRQNRIAAHVGAGVGAGLGFIT